MLRAARFAAQLGFTVAPDVVAAMVDRAPRLSIVSAERVKGELVKLLLGDHPRAGLELLVDTGLADVVLPELPALRLEIDEHHQHKDVYEHTLQVLEQAIALEDDGPDLVLRLAALLHDIGKPATRRFEPGGGVSFHHHEVVGAQMARKRLRALTFGKDVVEPVFLLTELHLRFHGYRPARHLTVDRRRRAPLRHRRRRAARAAAQAHPVGLHHPQPAALRAALAAYDDLEKRIAALAEQEELRAIRPDLDGAQIMEVLGVPPGPVVGAAYKHLLALRMENGPMPHDDAVAALRAWAANRGL